jgi:hypothetical protein
MAKKKSHSAMDCPGLDNWSSGGVLLPHTLFYGFMSLGLGVPAGLGSSNDVPVGPVLSCTARFQSTPPHLQRPSVKSVMGGLTKLSGAVAKALRSSSLLVGFRSEVIQ